MEVNIKQALKATGYKKQVIRLKIFTMGLALFALLTSLRVVAEIPFQTEYLDSSMPFLETQVFERNNQTNDLTAQVEVLQHSIQSLGAQMNKIDAKPSILDQESGANEAQIEASAVGNEQTASTPSQDSDTQNLDKVTEISAFELHGVNSDIDDSDIGIENLNTGFSNKIKISPSLPKFRFNQHSKSPLDISIYQQQATGGAIPYQQERDYFERERSRLFQPEKSWTPYVPAAIPSSGEENKDKDGTMIQFEYSIPFH